MKLIPKNVTGVLCYGKTLTLGLRCVDQSLKAVAGYLIFGKTVFLGFFFKLVRANCRARSCLGHDIGGKKKGSESFHSI